MAEAASCSITTSKNKNGRILFERALDLYQQVDDTAGEIRCLAGLGWTAINLGQIEAAQHHAKQALMISQAQGDPLGEAQALYTLGITWNFYYGPDQIESAANKSRHLYEQIGFQRRAIRPLLSLGIAHDMREVWAEALMVYEEALAKADACQDMWVAGWAAQLAGRIHLRNGELQLAEARLKQAEELRLTHNEQQNQVSDLAWLARLALAQGKPDLALSQTIQAIAKLDAFQGEFYVWEQPDVLMAHAEALAANGQQDAALAVARQAWETMCQFAQQIKDTAVLAQFMAYPANQRIKTAVSQQRIPIWPNP